MFATRNCALIALALVALAAASCEAGLFGHKDRNKNVVTQYVPVPSPAAGYYGAEEPHHHHHHHGLLGGHHGLHHNQHQGGHQVGHQGGYNGGGGGSAAASANAAGGSSAAASAAGGASASASAASASQPSYYYPQEPEYYEPPVRHQGQQQQQQHYAPQYEPTVYQPQQGGCIAPCYGGLGVQQVANVNMAPEKHRHHLFRRNKNAKGANPMVIQQQYVNNAQQPLY